MFSWKKTLIQNKTMKTRTRCTDDNRQVFQCHPPRNVVSLLDIQDAIDATYRLDFNNKSQYFYSVGIDIDRVCYYLETVKRLNSLWAKK